MMTVLLFIFFSYLLAYLVVKYTLQRQPSTTDYYTLFTHNQEDIIEWRIRKIIAGQRKRGKPLSVIVLDQNSEDQTRDIIMLLKKRYPNSIELYTNRDEWAQRMSLPMIGLLEKADHEPRL